MGIIRKLCSTLCYNRIWFFAIIYKQTPGKKLKPVNYLNERYKDTNDRKSKLVSNDMLLNALNCLDNEMMLLLDVEGGVVSHWDEGICWLPDCWFIWDCGVFKGDALGDECCGWPHVNKLTTDFFFFMPVVDGGVDCWVDDWFWWSCCWVKSFRKLWTESGVDVVVERNE